MPDVLAEALAILSDECKTHMSQAVVYRLGPVDAVPAPASQTVQATVGPVRALEFPSAQAPTYQEVQSRDFLLDPADLAFGPTAPERFEPDEGHELDFTDPSGAVTRWRVSPRDGEPAWRWSDPNHTRVRVHAVRVSLEEDLEPAQAAAGGNGSNGLGEEGGSL